nr:hypothetical protein Iba_chr06aCG0280 [Ipomoea batatas]
MKSLLFLTYLVEWSPSMWLSVILSWTSADLFAMNYVLQMCAWRKICVLMWLRSFVI